MIFFFIIEIPSISLGNRSLNRETSLSQWESGPRLNYGFNWLINYNDWAVNITGGQSLKLNKNSAENRNEKSDYFFTNIVDFKSFGYVKTDLTIDSESMYLKDNNISYTLTNIDLQTVKKRIGYDPSKIKTKNVIDNFSDLIKKLLNKDKRI